jgi:hypothetical protein
MSWERDPLWAKARLFFERAFNESRDDELFGFWCSLGLELLARAALASVSPTLLAEPDPNHKYLLLALNRGHDRTRRRSIKSAQVFGLCHALFDAFSEDDLTASLALTNRRNDELHSGAAAFDEYPCQQWLLGFYRACRSLANSMEESLESLFGEEEAKAATQILDETQQEVKQHTLNIVAAHRKVFEGKTVEQKAKLATEAEAEAQRVSYERHHRVPCPACRSAATVQGAPFGAKHVSNEEDGIVVRQAVSPRSSCCSACGLKLTGYAELDAAQLGGQYTRTRTYSPEEHYGLIDPDTFNFEEYLADRFRDYDNE